MKKAKLVKNITLIIAFVVVGLFLLGSTKCRAELNPDDLASQTSYGEMSGEEKFTVRWYATGLYSIGFGIAIVVSVIAIMYLGLKYITGGITDKVDYKKNIIPVLIGIGIIVFLSTILSIIARFGDSL